MESLYDPPASSALAGDLGGEGLYAAGAGARRDETLRHLRAAAERHRRAAHGPRAERLDPGRADPLAPDARLRHALAAGLRPRRHLDAERRREAADRRGHVAPGARPRRVPRAHVGLARADRPDDHGPVPPPRRLARLLARALHDGRRLRRRGDDVLRPPLGARAGSTARTGSSTGARYHQTAISDLEVEHVEMDDALTTSRYPFVDGDGGDRDRDRAAGDDPRRRRRRRAPGRPALPRRDRQGGRRPRRRAARAGDRRRRASSPSSARARSRSRRATTRSTSRSAATTGSRRSP